MVTGASAGPFVITGSIVNRPDSSPGAAGAASPSSTNIAVTARLVRIPPLRRACGSCSRLMPVSHDDTAGTPSVVAFLIRVAVNTMAIALAAKVIPGVEVDNFVSALAGGFLLGIVNALVRPVLLILTLPITFVTLGLFILVVNGACFWFVAWLI